MRPKRLFVVLGILLPAVLLAGAWALATGEAIPRSLLGSGGGRVSDNGLVVANVFGQPVVGSVDNGTVRLCSGFGCRGATPAVETSNSTVYLPLVLKQ